MERGTDDKSVVFVNMMAVSDAWPNVYILGLKATKCDIFTQLVARVAIWRPQRGQAWSSKGHISPNDTEDIGYYDQQPVTNIVNCDYFMDSRFQMPFYYIRIIAL